MKHFGSWTAALAAASLQPSEYFNAKSTDEALFENLETVWQGLGRQPTVNDMVSPLSAISADTYKRRFGGWRRALEAFVEAAASDRAPSENPQSGSDEATPIPAFPVQASRPRSVGWRLRYVVLCRDRFACRACGRSPATHPGVTLEVDHVIPWSRGGETVESNLQALCQQCNGGKSGAA